jgi:exodeoxyribonuclease V gamma subunit
VIVSKVGSVEFAPLATEDARAHLLTLLRAWDEGTRRPLPLAVKTAFAWLRKRPGALDFARTQDFAGEANESGENAEIAAALVDARDAARVTYEGAGRQQGERDTNAYLYRAYPDFSVLAATGEFERLAVALLLPLHRAIPASSSKSKSTPTHVGDAQ